MVSIITDIFKATSFSNIVGSLFYENEATKIGELVIDATTSEVVKCSNVITEHPVENKTIISDHIFRKPLEVQIEGVITDTPLKVFGIIETPLQKNSIKTLMSNVQSMLPFGKNIKPSLQAYKLLMQMYNNRTLVTLISRFEKFENMAIKDLSFINNESTGQKLQFSILLQQINFVNLKFAKNVTTSKIKNKILDKIDAGTKQIEKPQDSILYKMKESIKEDPTILSPKPLFFNIR